VSKKPHEYRDQTRYESVVERGIIVSRRCASLFESVTSCYACGLSAACGVGRMA